MMKMVCFNTFDVEWVEGVTPSLFMVSPSIMFWLLSNWIQGQMIPFSLVPH